MIRFLLACIAVCLALSDSAFGASRSLEFTVEAGRIERQNVPVRLAVSRNQVGDERILSVALSRMDGQMIPAQWTGPSLTSTAVGELHFILTHLAAGESLRLKATFSSQPANTEVFV